MAMIQEAQVIINQSWTTVSPLDRGIRAYSQTQKSNLRFQVMDTLSHWLLTGIDVVDRLVAYDDTYVSYGLKR